ncbi:bone morphogenetic protein 15 [Spea bombifrons]|uniref:bone morphogenetic protein 15 n=1 Tax=Spea bombifrons TaxID=233779 RepID=UPI002349ABBD|nr:bone morphogenetic protein 15 [Spea bombifrons]
MPGLPQHLLFLCLFIGLFPPAIGGNGLRALARSSSLPLIRTLMEHGPQVPHVAAKRDFNVQHLRFMLELYRKSADSDGRPKNGRQPGVAVRLVRPVNQSSFIAEGHWHVQNLTFKPQGLVQIKQLVKATVMHPGALVLGDACFSCKLDFLANAGIVLKTRVFPGNRKWAETDFTSHLKALIEGPRMPLNLELQLICRKVRMYPFTAVSPSYIPFLLLYLNQTLHSITSEERVENEEQGNEEPSLLIRKPRQTGAIGTKLPKFSNHSGQSRNSCVLRPFWVSFHQLGWDHWIIAPHRYNPGYCKGDCPRLLHSGYNSPNHAIIQNFINQVVDGSIPRPSCVPYSYGPISVLMIEPGGKILYKEYENMMAESCTCR